MNIREALIQQGPSLALQRAASDEIARLDARVREFDELLNALRETQNLCDVSQCPWCGVWGQNYAESERPADYCHHEYTLRPWRMFAPVAKKETT